VRVYHVDKISWEDRCNCYYNAEELDDIRIEFEMEEIGIGSEDERKEASEDREFNDYYYPDEVSISLSDDEDEPFDNEEVLVDMPDGLM
jgi:hypothetical protein